MNVIKNYLSKKIFYQNIKQGFFNKKKIIFISIFLLIFIFSLLMSFYTLKINPVVIWNLFLERVNNNPLSFLFIVIIFLYPLSRFLYIFSFVRPRLKSLGIKISFIEYFALCAKIVVISAITPFATGWQPYMIYWMKSRGATLYQANAICVSSTVISSSTELVLTTPSFVMISMMFSQISNYAASLTQYWLIVGGIAANVFILLCYLLIGYSKNSHYYISIFFNFILSKFSKVHLSKEEIYEKYLINNEFRNELKYLLSKLKFTLPVLISYLIYMIYYYNTLYLSFISLSNNDYFWDNKNYLDIFNVINVSITANNFIPIPGGEGTIQLSIISLIGSITCINLDTSSNLINNGVGFWRVMTNYIPIIVCSGITLFYFIIKFWLFKGRNKIQFI